MKIHCFTHWDVDGAVSYLVLKWFHKNINIDYTTSQAQTFRDDWLKWLSTNNVEDYDKIYITDLDVGEHIDLIDYKNVTIIDHHATHVTHIDKYKKAKPLIKVYSSAAKLIYKIMAQVYPDVKITDAQKKLIIIADDYDNYTLQIPDSKKLNILFWNTQKSFESFISNFSKGFYGFNIQQENIIQLHETKLKSIEENMSVYANKIMIQGKERYVCATFADTAINDIADILKDKYNAEIAIVVNTKRQSASFRRPKENTDVNVALLAQKLVDGGGHEYAAAGKITDHFVAFTKMLKQIK
jgi:oligoribonuclease NrnB/cAMP/cGMP phosphodiesterase (DHH superfamily)